MNNILSLDGKTPRVAEGAFIAPNAVLIGDVVIEAGASVWFGCVLRADVGSIRVGPRSNIQDLTMIHMTDGLSVAEIGADVTVGHGAIVHGARVGDGALIGMGAILLDNAVIGARSVIAAGSLVPPRMIVPPGMMVRGSPAKVLREASEEERAMGATGAAHYVANARRYAPLFPKGEP